MHIGALLSCGWLNACLPMEGGEYIPCGALLACAVFFLCLYLNPWVLSLLPFQNPSTGGVSKQLCGNELPAGIKSQYLEISLSVRVQFVDHYPKACFRQFSIQFVLHPVCISSSRLHACYGILLSMALLVPRQMTHTTPSSPYKESLASKKAISQAYFGLGKSMLSVPKHILVTCLKTNSIRSFSVILWESEGRLSDLLFILSFFLPFLKSM